MWVKLLCVLVVSGSVNSVRIFEGEKNDQEKSGEEKCEDQEGSASSLLTRSPELQHSFGVKVEHPFGKDLQGIVVEQKENHVFGKAPSSVDQHEFQPSQTNRPSIGGEWKGINRFRQHEDQQSKSHDLSQHQVLGQVLQGLGQVNQILGKSHQGIAQVNTIFGQGNQDYQKHNSFTNGGRELFALEEKKLEEHRNLVDTNLEVSFEKAVGGVNNKLVESKDVSLYNVRSDSKSVKDPYFLNLPNPTEKVEVNNKGAKIVAITKKIPVPHTIEVEKKVPFEVEVPVEKPYAVERPRPYPVYVEKKVPYKMKEYIPQPYTVYKRVPYTVKVHVNKPYPIHVPKPYRVLVEKKVPYQVEKHVPYPVRVYVDKPYPIHVPVLRTIPYTVEKKVPLPVQLTIEKPYPVPVPKPYKVYVEKKLPYSALVPMYRQQGVEASGQPPGTTDQGTAMELQSYQQHPQWRKYLPYPVDVPMNRPHEIHQQENEASRQPGITDQRANIQFQIHHQHSQWSEHVPNPTHVPMYHPHELDKQEVLESGQPSRTTDQGAAVEFLRHQQHPQWREHVTYAMYSPAEMDQQEVEVSGQLSRTLDQSAAQRHEQPTQWREHSSYPMYHPQQMSQQEVEWSGQSSRTTDQSASVKLQKSQLHPQYMSYPVEVPTYQHRGLGQQVLHESGMPVTTDQSNTLEVQQHNPSQWREHAPHYQ